MTDPTRDPTRDPFDVLRSHVHSVALLERPETTADDLIASITGGSSFAGGDVRRDRSNVIPFRSPRRRRWLVATSAVAIVAVGSAGVAAYVGSRPTVPSADLLCRGSASGDGSSIAVALGDDPIGQCAELWRSGALPDIDRPAQPTTQIPRLVACTGTNGSVEVLPLGAAGSCADVGLSDADVAGLADDPVLGLRRDLVRLVNDAPCRPATEVMAAVQSVLAARGLSTWSITVRGSDLACARVMIDVERSQIELFPDPNTYETTEETP